MQFHLGAGPSFRFGQKGAEGLHDFAHFAGAQGIGLESRGRDVPQRGEKKTDRMFYS